MLPVLIVASGLLVSAAGTDCSFLNNPDEFVPDVESRHLVRSDLTSQVSMMAFDELPAGNNLDANAIPRKNFIDDAIFNRMASAGIRSAPLSSDAEFLRRVTLDLTGRIPSGAEVDAFLADTNPAKRDRLVDSLVGTPEFIDKWTMFFGDLLRNTQNGTQINLGAAGRDTYYLYIKDAVTRNKPYDEMARELIASTGDTLVYGAANWPVNNIIAMGPAQDTYDGQAVQLSSMFLGINATDCLLCHDGPRHLDQLNLWGATQTRRNMWGLSAYFARARMQRQVITQIPQLFKFIVTDVAIGDYNLNTTTGNRTARQPINGVRTITPSYPFQTGNSPVPTGSGALTGETYRAAIGRLVTGDLQFSRAAVNYIWEKFMVEAFVSPSNGFDLARLDPNNPPPAPWTLQPTNPELLDQLARWFQQNRHDIRALIALIAKSSAYQLSSTYSDTWDISYVPYYARKYVRRLDAEEIHDAIAKATGILGNYRLGDTLPPAQWAMQLPDTRGPNSNGAVVQFLNAFGRGDRDTNPRKSEGSILQTLNLMNNAFVMTRIHQNNAGSRVAALLSQTQNAQTIIRELYLNTLSRPPRADEIAAVTPMFQQLGNRAAAESLQWMLLNKLDFIFNY
jgi:hypothetical protein